MNESHENELLEKNCVSGNEDINHIPNFTHKHLLEITKSTLNELLQNDTLLSNLPSDIAVEEVNAQIALEHGQSITVYVEKEDGEKLPVVVKQKDATVLDLKKAIRRHMIWKLNREKQRVKISWKYIWKTYNLQFDADVLNKDNAFLHELGVTNRSKVTFTKKLRHKGVPV